MYSDDPTAHLDEEMPTTGRGDYIVPLSEKEAFKELLIARKQAEVEAERNTKQKKRANDEAEAIKNGAKRANTVLKTVSAGRGRRCGHGRGRGER